MTVWSDDRGRLGERIASIRPRELHQAIAAAASHAIRHGVPAELLDGRRAAQRGHLLGAGPDRRLTRIAHLEDRIAEAERRATNARRNANLTDDPEIAAQLLDDAKHAHDDATQLRGEHTQALTQHDSLGSAFSSEADYVTHALANLAAIEHDTDRAIADALSHILHIERMTVLDDQREVEVTFTIDVPADDRVARLGPIACRVRNHANLNTLKTANSDHLLIAAAIRHGLADSLRHRHDTAILRAVAATMAHAGYTARAASIASRAAVSSLHAVIAHDLWEDPLPDGIDPAYVTHVLAVYKNPHFAWNMHRHAVDPTDRQALVDLVADAGGRLDTEQLNARIGRRRAHLIRVYSRPQTIGDAPPWEPCVQRGGDWQQGRVHKGAERYLKLVGCPHCGGHATTVIRTPETLACLLCPDCRRMPTANSPRFPDEYLMQASGTD